MISIKKILTNFINSNKEYISIKTTNPSQQKDIVDFCGEERLIHLKISAAKSLKMQCYNCGEFTKCKDTVRFDRVLDGKFNCKKCAKKNYFTIDFKSVNDLKKRDNLKIKWADTNVFFIRRRIPKNI